MPAPISLPLRRAMWRRWQSGKSVGDIAQALGLHPRSVRQLLHNWIQQTQPVLAPAYRAGNRTRSAPVQQLHDHALAMRQEHPSWGAGLIRVLLGQQFPSATLPTERTLQRWFHQAGLGPAPKGRRPASNVTRAQRPHEVWQVDAKEQVRLSSGQRVSWLRVVDECSGAVLATVVFPPRELVEGSGHRRPNRAAPRFRALGSAAGGARGQWRPVGFGRGFAA